MNDKLPIVVKENKLINSEKNKIRLVNKIKKICLGSLSIGVAGIAVGIGLPIAVEIPIVITGLTGFVYNVADKKTSDSMFITLRTGKNLSVAQFGSIKGFKMMKDLKKGEKACMMGLELMTMMKGYQQEYRDKGIEMVPSKDGKNMVYPQVFEATTHGVNIKMIEALEKLGYVEIVDKKEKWKSTLAMERILFGEYKEAREALKARIFNSEKRKDYERQMYKIEMRLTDKELNLEDLYKTYLEKKATRGKSDDRKAYKRIGLMIEALREQNIDIRTNELGEQELVKADTSLAKRVEKEIEEEKRSKKFMEAIDARGENDEPVVVHEQENERTTERANEGEEKE